jgi:alpha-beta hydrolase superfamily lysophospholipase
VSNPIGHAAETIGGGIPRVHEVVVSESSGTPVMAQAPQSVGDRVARIPATDNPIRIERYVDDAGRAHSEVYIAGTHDWGTGTTREPFDLNSNIALVAGIPAASLVGVQSAMTRAGIKHGERVTFTGHSQGGMIAARLAESGTYRTTGLVVVGSPTGTLSATGGYPALALRHTDDVVPLLGGSDQGSGFTTIERASTSPIGDVVGAHKKSGYVQMARDLDSSPAGAHLPKIVNASGTAEVRVFTAQRVSS